MKIDDLHFMIPSEVVTPESKLYRLPSMPPPDDFVIAVDDKGNDLSCYGDGYWNYKQFGYIGFNFDKQQISEDNQKLVKQGLLLAIYHPNLFPGKIDSCKKYFACLNKIAKVCDEQGVLMSDLSKYPRIHPMVAKALQCAQYKAYIRFLHKLRINENLLGFVIADEKTLAF